MNYLKFTLIFFLCWTSYSVAAVLDKGEVTFSGYVIDSVPLWAWQLSSPDQVWDVDVSDAKISSDGKQVFSLRNHQNLPFLEGHLKKIAERGGPGLTPIVSFYTDGGPVELTNGGTSTKFRAFIPVKNIDSGEYVGHLSFDIEQAMMISQGKIENNRTNSTDISLNLNGPALASMDANQNVELSDTLINRLSVLMAMNNGVISAGVPLVYHGEGVSSQVLSNNRIPKLAGAYASQLSNFSLSWPQEKVPSRWRATLGVSVTIQ